MKSYVVLLRGVNVGGKNKVSMAKLRDSLESLGFLRVTTYIASGNVLLSSDKLPVDIQKTIENALTKNFKLDSELIKVLVLSRAQMQAVVSNRPAGFGDHPETYHSDAIFLMDIAVKEAMQIFQPREGVDMIWPGEGVVYSRRVSALRAKSKLSKIMLSPLYKSMTIRSWNTTVRLLDLLNARDADN